MKTDLSSQIKLYKIPHRFLDPRNEAELAALTRYEKVNTKIFELLSEARDYAANEVVNGIKDCVSEKGFCVMALGASSAELTVCNKLVEYYKQGLIDFSNVIVFNIYEFFNRGKELENTVLNRLKENFLDKVNIRPENIHSYDIDTDIADIQQMCVAYEEEIEECGGIDLMLCEIGSNGIIGLNEPGSQVSSHCRIVYLGSETLDKIRGDYKWQPSPTIALTLGLRNVNTSRRFIGLAAGENWADVVEKIVEGKITDAIPASYLQMHSNATIVVDLPAAADLTRISRPWKIATYMWTDKLIRRAVVWLCQITGKPILKLTNKDYNDNGLGELLALYGSAYNVNIRIFNELQHTITGWPGGKPDADDTYRPERANPYPKRVVVFSPHPDDDVISMGGTLKRLVDQKHDVHVAYQTSGNIAVGDEDMMRYIMVMDKLGSDFGSDSKVYLERSKEIHDFIANKNPGDSDILPIRKLKGIIRQCEATTACNYVGIKKENIHFCNLPFYETGTIKKGEMSQADVDIIKDLLQKVKPHQIFVAGDLADPHGTHRVCTDAVLAAVDECLDEDWMRDCRIWMYRGAWAEWEIDHIEMAVPISPEELRFKRNSILKHQSQMENAPFLGSDERLFWQRAEDRNRATAKLYADLGLASYEAIEAFVEYVPIKF